MLNRRLFVSCAICAASGLIATDAGAQATPGVTRTILQRTDAPGQAGYEIVLARGDVPAGATVARHTHPGVETAYVLEGSGEFMMDGQPDRPLKAGDSFQVPAGTIHAIQNGAAPMKIASTYVVEKGKPLATLV